jgi:uncharacterized protein
MRYLLDVNSLLALGVFEHEFHQRVALWFDRISKHAKPELATCSITELGFVRVLGQAQQYGFAVLQARDLLARLKASELAAWTFIEDDQDVSHLPKWVKTSKQTTDGHLVGLAKAHNSVLATLDRRIPGALVIPIKS